MAADQVCKEGVLILSVEQLEGMMRQQPRPVALYFVDCRDRYWQLVNKSRDFYRLTNPRRYDYLKALIWDNHDKDSMMNRAILHNERREVLAVADKPGLWLKWSDGRFQRVEFVQAQPPLL